MRWLTLLLSALVAGCSPATLNEAALPDGAAVPRVEGVSGALGPLGLAARARIEADTLYADVEITNRTDRPLQVGYGACSSRILAWPDSQRTGRPAFRSVRSRTADGYLVACTLALALATIEAGASLSAVRRGELGVRVALAEIVPDSVPDGRYWLTAEFDVAEFDGRRVRDTLRADLGPLDVVTNRPPLGAAALRFGSRFAVDSVRVEGRQLRAVVRVAPVQRLGPEVAGWAPCAVRVLAFADAARRDRAPRAGPPDARLDGACEQVAPTPFVPDGRPEDAFYTAIEAPIRVEIDLGLDDLLGDLPAGSYALAVVVRTLGRRGAEPTPLPPVTLRLADVDWRP